MKSRSLQVDFAHNITASQFPTITKQLEVEPWAYLKDTLNKLACKPSQGQLTELLPDHWLAQNLSHQWKIAQQRRAERDKKTNSN